MSEDAEVRRYAARELKALGHRYTAHMQAMTAENVHSKSDIAAELAWRDWVIECERHARDTLRAENERAFRDIASLREKLAAKEAEIHHAYQAGWCVAAAWADRDDLKADIGSPAYVTHRTEALKEIA